MTLLQYEAPCGFTSVSYSRNSANGIKGPVYALDWCKSPAPNQKSRPRSSFRLGLASFTEDARNRIAIVGLQDERVLVEDNYTDYSDFVTLAEAHHGYPATALQWQPPAASSYAWQAKSPSSELLATTGDALRVWEYTSDGQPAVSGYVGRQATAPSHHLQLKTCLNGVRTRYFERPPSCLIQPLAIKSAKSELGCTIDQFLLE